MIAAMCLKQKNPTTDIFSSTIPIFTIAFGMPKLEKHNEFTIHLSKRNQELLFSTGELAENCAM